MSERSGLSRRAFLQAVGYGAAGGALGTGLATAAPWLAGARAFAGAPIGPADGVLVLVTLYGGNDGLDTMVPYTNGSYYDQRGEIAIAPEGCLPLDDAYALHGNLPTLKKLWDAGQVAALHGVGYAPPDLSHFSSTAIWMSGHYGPPDFSTGWVGRWLDDLGVAQAELAVAEIGVSVPLSLKGSRRDRGAVAIPTSPVLLHPPDPSVTRTALAAMVAGATPSERGAWGDAVAASLASTVHLADEVAAAYPAGTLDSSLPSQMTMAARLINADIGLRVISVSLGGFDTHAAQPDAHPALLAELDAGLAAFFATLGGTWRRRVVLATLSEFGRTPYANLSRGTDHGTANVQFVVGANVAGGSYGEAPRLQVLDANRRLIPSLDFRTLYGNLLQAWMGADGAAIIGGSFEDLGLFAAGPGQQPPPVQPAGAAPLSGFVPLAPLRLFDTRDGTGGRAIPLAGGEEWRVAMGGRHGVPGEARAVVINLTATEATDRTFVTAWNAGTPRPLASNLNPRPGRATPNHVVGRIGTRGEVSFTNGVGTVDLVGDLVGYFDPATGGGIVPLVPRRLLDTRDTASPLGEQQSLDLQVAGVGDVPAGATAVAINVTATEPTQPSFLTIWPAGVEMPTASSVNMLTGQTVPNMVIAATGAGGKVSMFNRFGSTHVVVDVLGCFVPGTTAGRFVAITPHRVLDTRDGTGAPAARVRQTDLAVQVAGVGSVPGDATAALLNVTAVLPSQPTFVTVYPSDSARPLASNLNAFPDDVVPNTVIARLGADGRVMLFNGFGDIDLVADVMGYFVR